MVLLKEKRVRVDIGRRIDIVPIRVRIKLCTFQIKKYLKYFYEFLFLNNLFYGYFY